jgi:hypothetical protein
LVNDLFTEVTHALHVIPDTESVTVLISASAAVVKNVAATQQAASNTVSCFTTGLLVNVLWNEEWC